MYYRYDNSDSFDADLSTGFPGLTRDPFFSPHRAVMARIALSLFVIPESA
ncbi:hypothetical protein X907_0934 [Glycocaulis alkaliphilus]|uniref:Uncharacterized protein n=1 Tax=Glycocaulis alkaliphilus TaxID=1434191 RepID=A0A3T0E849_9PROT|nr:hypothetical protein X907_0934 [Glycocaulis alkaliphilus]